MLNTYKPQTDDLNTFESSLYNRLNTTKYPGIPLADIRKQFPYLTPATLLYRVHRLERLGRISIITLGGRLFLRKIEDTPDPDSGLTHHPDGGDPR